jgi:hypothetical protein
MTVVKMDGLLDRFALHRRSNGGRCVGAWAIAKGLWQPRPMDLAANFARDMAEALREQMRTGRAGRRYRAKIPAKSKTTDGMTLFKWAATLPHARMLKGAGVPKTV